MLQPARDRLDYSQIVTPPGGYRFEAAVGTTYSLDLAALLGIPIALVLGQSPDERLRMAGIPLLEALRKTAGKIALFCQAGRIAVPHEQRELYALLEKSIAHVLPPRDYSFHPKVWVIKYVRMSDKSDALFRVIVLSRNLTFDRSWDVAAVLDGRPSGSTQTASAPLSDFLSYLSAHHSDIGMRRMVKRMAGEVGRVLFEPDDRRFQSVHFCPTGIPGSSVETPLDGPQDSITVISPFLSKSRVSSFTKLLRRSGKAVLISRKEELDKLGSETTADIECWHLKDAVVDGEDALDETDALTSRQDVHAKLYLTTRYSWSKLWVGSANCSDKAFTGNVEFLLRLEGYRRYCNQADLLKDLMGDDERQNPFARYEVPACKPELPDESEDRVLERLTRDVCRAISSARAIVSPQEGNSTLYDIETSIPRLPSIPSDMVVTIEPLCRPQAQVRLAGTNTFLGMPLAEINTLYVIRMARLCEAEQTLRAFVLTISTTGIPDTRDSAIYKSIIASKDEFFAYIAFILGEDYTLSLADSSVSRGSFGFGQANGVSKPVVYEKMLKAASRRPESLAEIRDIIDLCGGDCDIISDEFRSMYAKFEAVVTGRRRKR